MEKQYKTTEAQRRAMKRYREKHKEEMRQYQKKYREEHKEEGKQYQKKYREGHVEGRKQYMKKYHKEHREEANMRHQEWEAANPGYSRERYARIRGEAPWMFHWWAAKQRCDDPSCDNYRRYGGKGIRMLLTKLEMELLYKRDHADQMKKPSIDRINPRGDYHFGNCRFLELSENTRRSNVI